MIEEIPLTFEVHNAVMVGPTAVGLLRHNQSLVFIGSHWMLAHGIGKHLGVFPHIWISQVKVTVVLECEWSFCLTIRQTFETVYANHFHLSVTPLDNFLWVVVSEFLHVFLEFGTASISPENVSITVRSLEYARINAIDTLDRLWFRNKTAIRTVADGHSYGKATPFLRCIREIEIVLTIPLHTVWCPHRIGLRISPGHILLRNNDAMILPIYKVVGRKNVVVSHTEPVFPRIVVWRQNIMRRIEINPAVKNTRRGIGRELITNDRVLSHQPSAA